MKTKSMLFPRRLSCALALVLAVWAGAGSASAAKLVRGELNREVYTNIFGPLISDLTNNAKFPASPDITGTITYFETPTDWAEMYGERVSGYLLPPVTGEYTFYLCSDDQGALFLSTDNQRSNLVLIATESNWCWRRNWTDISAGRTNHENISKPIYLEAGKAYYLEGLHKEFGGGDNFAVAWQPPGADVPANGSDPIPGQFLGIPRSDQTPIVNVVTPHEGDVLVAGSDVQLGANVLNVDDSLIRVEFYANEMLLGVAAGPAVTPAGNYLLTWDNVPLGEYGLTARVVDASGIVTVSAPVQVTVQQGPPPPGERELHVVSVYSGNYNGGPSPNHEEGKAAVMVNRPGQKVTLCLCAYEPVLWTVTPSTGTVIERVILSGYYAQRIQGVGPEVEIVKFGFGDGAGSWFWPGYEVDSGRFYQAVPVIYRITGLEIGSFHGAYTALYQPPFIIDSLQNDPRLRSDYPQPTPPSELPPLSFNLTFFTGSGPGQGEVFSRSYTLGGPAVGSNVLPGLRLVPDAGGRYFYAALSQSVMRVDSQTGIGETMDLGGGVPELSWSMGMAFDSLRNRELLATLGGEGYLYAYSPDSFSWSVVSSMDNRDVDSIVYHRALDQIFGFEVYRGDYNRPKLFRFTSAGTYHGEIPLPVLPWDVGVSSYASELVSVGDYLVLLVGPDAAQPWFSGQRTESRMYLIDPRSNQVWLTYRHVPTNQPPVVVLTLPTEGSLFGLGTPIHVFANAFDPDGTVESVELFADGQSVAKIQRSWGPYEFIWNNATLGTHTLVAKARDNEFATTESPPVHVTVTLPPPPPILDWEPPADIVYGTPLSQTQLNATANINTPGIFMYAPPAGTILGAGQHILSVTFTPVGTSYPIATATVPLFVLRAPLTIRADDKTKAEGEPNPPLTATYSGLVAGDTPSSLDQPPTLTTSATTDSPPGSYPILVSGAGDANYSIEQVDGTLTVVPAIDRPGSTDLSFDVTGGGELVGFEGDQGFVYRLALQPDGKVLATGDFVGASGVSRRDLVRLNPNGATDLSFRATITAGRFVEAIAIEPDGHILIAGNFNEVNHQARPNLARLNPNGSLDLSFAPVLEGATHDLVKSIVVQPDGKILIGGNFSSVNTQPRYHVARLTPDGQVDPSFVPALVPLGDNSQFNCLGLQPDGKVLVGHATCDSAMALRRLNPDGSLDRTFTLGVNPGTWCVGVRQVQMAPEGKIVIYGEFGPWRYVARLNEDGSEDKSFAPPPFVSVVKTILAQPDGKVLIGAADNETRGATPNGIFRLNVDGSIDTSFQVPEEAVGHPNAVYALALRLDGRVLFGKAYNSADANRARAIMQLMPDGSVDPAFRYRMHPAQAYISAIVALQDGGAIVGGHFSRLNDEPRFGIARVNRDGTLDRNFVPPEQRLEWVATLALQADGRVLVGGSFSSTNGPFSRNLVRLNSDGSLDRSFSLPEGAFGPVHTLLVQPDGKIIVGSGLYIEGQPQYLSRLNPDGSLDDTFETGSGVGGDDISVEALALQRDGKILVGGTFQTFNGIPRKALIRVNADGRLDQAFTPPDELQWAWRIALQPDGKILVLGETLMRLMPDGRLDGSFNAPGGIYGFALEPAGRIIVYGGIDPMGGGSSGGRVTRLNPDGSMDPTFVCQLAEDWLNTIVLQPDGQVLIGGWFEEVNGAERACLARLNNRVIAPQHPADVTSDWMMDASEVAAYAWAWRSGEGWVAPPNPVPIDYVTRAAMLSLGGANYAWSGNGAAPPLWWVNVPVITPVGVAKGLEPWATRHLPRWYVPGQPFEVSIQLAPEDGAQACALQENIPVGCGVTEISDGGLVDPLHRQIKWGPFAQTGYRSVRYTLVHAASSIRPVTFAGVVSCDGANQRIEGADLVLRGTTLSLGSRTNRLFLQLQSETGNVFVIESSTDLLQWRPVQTVTNESGMMEMAVPVTSEPQRYYRARSAGP